MCADQESQYNGAMDDIPVVANHNIYIYLATVR